MRTHDTLFGRPSAWAPPTGDLTGLTEAWVVVTFDGDGAMVPVSNAYTVYEDAEGEAIYQWAATGRHHMATRLCLDHGTHAERSCPARTWGA